MTADVRAAVRSRRSCRQFLPDPVDPELVLRILREAGRAPSGGNLQPWTAHVLLGAARDALVADVAAAHQSGAGEAPDHDVYPADLADPFRSRRSRCGQRLYRSLGIERGDQAGKLRQLALNWEFFGAPVGIIVAVDRQMGAAQFADVGCFLQTVALLAKAEGLDTCLQGAWAFWPSVVRRHCPDIAESQIVFCGIALGRADEAAPVNALVMERADPGEWLFARL